MSNNNTTLDPTMQAFLDTAEPGDSYQQWLAARDAELTAQIEVEEFGWLVHLSDAENFERTDMDGEERCE